MPDDLFQFFTGIRKDILDVDRFFSFVLLISSRHHSKNRNGKTYVGALVRYVYKDDNGEFNLLYYKNILTVMRYYSSIYPDNIM